MPFDPDNPPEKVRGLPANKQRQFCEVFNSCFEKHHDDALCHKQAWGVAGRKASESAARSLLGVAMRVLGGFEEVQPARYLAEDLKHVRGVLDARVNDWSTPSQGVHYVDIFVWADPVVGGRLTNTLKAALRVLSARHGVMVNSFWSPRSDRSISEIGLDGLRKFYARNPYKIEVVVRAA